MTKTVNKSVCRGIAGKRKGKVVGVIIHNDAGSIYATPEHYIKALSAMNNSQLENGFAHYYINKDTIARVEDTFNKAWHVANGKNLTPVPNESFIGYEVCQSMEASDADFLKAEQVTFKQVAEDLKYYGLKPSKTTIRLHQEFDYTACPHRSLALHGKTIKATQQYFIDQVSKYYNTAKPSDKPSPKPPSKPVSKPSDKPVSKPSDKPPKKPVSKPSPKPSGIARVAQKGKFLPNTTVAIKYDPKVKAVQVASLGIGESVIYDSYVKSDGYIWVSYIRAGNKKRAYVCAREVKTNKPYGTFL